MRKYLLLVIILYIGLTSFTACKSREYDVEGQFELGYEGIVKIAKGNPFVATITNKGSTINGEVQIDINKDGESKIVIAQPIEIPEGAQKQIKMSIPIHLIQGSFDVRVVADNKTIYTDTIKVKKFLPPDQSVIAVVSDQPDNYRFLKNSELEALNLDEEAVERISRTSYSTDKEREVYDNRNPVVLYFDDFSFINYEDALEYFDYLYLGANKALRLGEEAKSSIDDWIANGHTLFLEAGTDYKKTYEQLPKEWQHYSITEIQKTDISHILGRKSDLEKPVSVAAGKINDTSKTKFIGFDNVKIGTVTPVGSGNIFILAMNFSEEPLKSWSYSGLFLNTVYQKGIEQIRQVEMNNFHRQGIRYTHFLRSIPGHKRPPFLIIFAIFIIYIAVVGPILYAIFKRKDKRDLLWIGIPAASVMCLLVLYIVGFSTRYQKPIANGISNITYVDGEEFLRINSSLALFNNKKGDMEISWGDEEKITVYDDDGYYYGNERENKVIVGKMTKGALEKYKVYDVPLWTPSYVSTQKIVPIKMDTEKPFIDLKVEDNAVSVTVKNNSELPLKYAFVRWRNKYIYIGNLASGEEKNVVKDINTLHTNFDNFSKVEIVDNLKLKYSNNSQWYQSEEFRNYGILESLYYNKNNREQRNIEHIELYGLNFTDIGYDINVNEKETENYHRNLVTIITEIQYNQGEKINFDHNTISPLILFGTNELQLDSWYNQTNISGDEVTLIPHKGILEFVWQLPESIDISHVEMQMDNVYDFRDYSEINSSNSEEYKVEDIQHSIWNEEIQDFENISEKDLLIDVSHKKYRMDSNEIRLRIDLRSAKINFPKKDEWCTQIPTIKVEGRAK